MILKRVPPSILLALGLGCGPSTGDDDTSTSTACLSPPADDDGTEVGPCLSECLGVVTDEGTTTTTSSSEVDVDSCLDATSCLVTSCLEPPLDTSSSSGSSDSTGTDSSGGTDSGSESGTDGTTGGMGGASPRERDWNEALQRMESDGTLPADVLARLRATKGPR